MKSILFVCTGNICRSPTAEAVFRDRVLDKGFKVVHDSVGTHGYHVGEAPDHRSIEMAQSHGISMDDLVARKLDMKDFDRFDLLIAMDKGHKSAMIKLCRNEDYRSKVKLLLDYHENHIGVDVPDPYYGGVADFERTYKLIEKGIDALIAEHFSYK